jgi:uncharacterized protein (DUF1778 family)
MDIATLASQQGAGKEETMAGKLREKRLLICVNEEEHRLLQRAAKLQTDILGLRVAVATFIRREAVRVAKDLLRHETKEASK